METHKIDSIIKKAIDGSENHYDSEADAAKDRIWNQIQLQEPNRSKPVLLRLLAVACILLLIGLSAITISNIRHRNTIDTLVELNHKLQIESATAHNVIVRDTVIIQNKVIEYKPLITTKHITDTVYIQKTVYVEKEQKPALSMANEHISSTDSIIQTAGNNYKSEILIRNKESLREENTKKLRIKFGSNREQANSGSLAFRTNL